MAGIWRHLFQSAKPQGTDATRIRRNDWNAYLRMDGGATGALPAVDDADSVYRSALIAAVAAGRTLRSRGVATLPAYDEDTPQNYLANGDFEHWLAGTAVAPTYWTLGGAGASVARDGTNKKLGLYAAAITRAGTDCYLEFDLEATGLPDTWWRGKVVTLGCWVRATVASRARLLIVDSAGSSASAYHSGGSSFEFLTVTRTVDAAAISLVVRLQIDTGNTTAQFDGAILALGQGLADFVPDRVMTPAGGSGSLAGPVGHLHVDTGSYANSGSGETDMAAYTLKANVLNQNRRALRITAWGTCAANGNTKTLKFYVGASAITLNWTTTAPNNVQWRVELLVWRTGASSWTVVPLSAFGAVLQVITSSSPTESTAADVTLKFTGQGAISNDIRQFFCLVELLG